MSDEKRPLWPWTLGVLIGLPVLYILGIGPVMRLTLYVHENSWPGLLCQIYLYPALQASYRSEVLQFVFGQYVRLWMPSAMPGPEA